jgi:septal ring-binding cell division protein DamX
VCLECGGRVSLTYRRPPSWKVPVAITAGVIVLALVGAALAYQAVTDDARREVAIAPANVPETPARAREKSAAKKRAAAKGKAPSRAVQAKPKAKPKPKPRKPKPKPKPREPRPAPPAVATGGGLVKRGPLYSWPRSLKGFTVVLLSNEDRASATSFARSASRGRPAKIGVIRADDFKSLPKGFFVVFAGQYRNRAMADKAAARLGGRFKGAFPQLVSR